jgi:hypothetical protein
MKRTFIIPSVIYFSGKKLSYSDIRSVFSPEERVNQTLKTISSIKNILPDANIVFLELGSRNDFESVFSNKVDRYIYMGSSKIVYFFCNGPFKGLGEVVGLLCAREKYFDKDTDQYFKLSGRYYLDEDFSLDHFSLYKFSFLKRENTISTRLFSFPGIFFNYWVVLLWKSIPYLLIGLSLERVFLKLISINKIYFVDKLGVTGNIAPTGELIKE